VCTGGQIRGTNGTCACATGKELVGGTCVAICPINTARNAAGVCAPTVCSTDPTVDTDGDGIKDVVEAAGPNKGDGNGDGIQDCLQKDVASGCTRPDKCSTIAVTGSCNSFGKTGIIQEKDLPIQDPVYDYPFGLYTFEVACTGTAQLVTYWYGVPNTPSQIARKFGPTTPGDDSTAKFFDFPSDSRELIVIGGQSVLKITQTLRDGGFGDATVVDGIIKDPMGLAVLAISSTAPVATVVKTGATTAINALFAISSLSVLALGAYAVFITRSRQMATQSIRSKKE